MLEPTPKLQPAAPADEGRCTRSNNFKRRCSLPRSPGFAFCKKHLKYEKNPNPRVRVSKIKKPKSNPREVKSMEIGQIRVRVSKMKKPKPNPDPNEEKPMEIGQFWAFTKDSDEGISRHYVYARIDRIDTIESSVEATILDPHPILYEEMLFVEKALPMSCGTFKLSRSTVEKPISAFSHRILPDSDKKGGAFYKIFPKKDEVWAVYSLYDGLKRSFEYKLVEVLLDFSEDDGVSAVALDRVRGSDSGVYGRQLHEGFQMIRRFERAELLLFSHQIPASRIVDGGNKLWKVKCSNEC